MQGDKGFFEDLVLLVGGNRLGWVSMGLMSLYEFV
jgi:hypothetical protein